MTAAKKPTPEPTKVWFTEHGDALLVERRRHTWRFLFTDGTTVDVVGDRDDSDVRGALLAHLGKEAIAGVARLPEP